MAPVGMGYNFHVTKQGSRRFSEGSTHIATTASLIQAKDPLRIARKQDGKEIQLARLVKDITHSSSPIVYVPYQQAYEEGFEDMQRRVPDIGKVRQLIGYAPSMTLARVQLRAYWDREP